MKKILKGIEPNTLTEYRSSIPIRNRNRLNVYNDFNHKSKQECKNNKTGNLRKQLLEEQGYICCYCMSRIDCYNSKIEHFKDQTNNRPLQITYSNLFIACRGNEGQPYVKQHCDTFKGKISLNSIDLLKNIENQVKYKPGNGILFSNQKNINQEINEVLNLNTKTLKKNRKQAYEGYLNNLKKKFGISNAWSKNNLEKELIRYQDRDINNKFKQFSEMFVFFLNKKIKSL